jgi:hypothetical protein
MILGHMSSNGAVSPAELVWRKASYCASGECIEVAQRDGVIILRDSTQPSGRMLYYATDRWRSFVRDVKAGELNVQRP